jgi:hypothetical protein
MAQPKGFNNLAKSQRTKFDLLSVKEKPTEKELELLSILQKKLNLFLNPPVLSAGAHSYLVEVYSREKYGLKRASAGGMAKSTQIKGFALEKEGLELLSKIDGVPYQKEVTPIYDEYFMGVCDTRCPVKNKVVEVKTSWNVANFMKNKKEDYKLPSEIWGQVQGYLHLYKVPKGQVCYVLVNTPVHLIEQEWANLFKRYTFGEITREKYDEGCYKLEGLFDYNKIPEKKRVIRFDIDYSPAYIDRAKTKVEMARLWLNDFEKRYMSVKNIATYSEKYLYCPEFDNEDESEPTT